MERRTARLEERLAGARSVDQIVDALVTQLEDFVGEEPGAKALIYEMFSVSRRNDDIRDALADLYRNVRGQVAQVLRDKERDGVVKLRGDAESVASLLFALGDGLELQLASDDGWDSSETFAAGIRVARFLLGEDA